MLGSGVRFWQREGLETEYMVHTVFPCADDQTAGEQEQVKITQKKPTDVALSMYFTLAICPGFATGPVAPTPAHY